MLWPKGRQNGVGMGRLAKAVGCGAVALLGMVLGACGDDDDPVATDDTVESVADDTTTTAAPADGDEASDDDAADDDESSDDDDAGDADAGDIDACGALEGVDLDGLLGAPAGDPNDASTDMGAACTVAYGTGGSGGVSFAVTTHRSAENYGNKQALFAVDEKPTGPGATAFRSGGHLFVTDGQN